jgi:hypothetical protein
LTSFDSIGKSLNETENSKEALKSSSRCHLRPRKGEDISSEKSLGGLGFDDIRSPKHNYIGRKYDTKFIQEKS